MSMANVPGTNEVRESLATVAESTRQRAREIAANLTRLVVETTDIEIGSRAALRAVQDDHEVIAEEAAQLTAVIGGTPPVPPPAPPAVTPVPPAAPAASQTVVLPPPPTAHACATATAINGSTVLFNVRRYSGVQWFLAIIGALIGMVVARYSYHSLFGNIHNDWGGFLIALWFAGIVTLGFGLGGYVGARFEERNRA